LIVCRHQRATAVDFAVGAVLCIAPWLDAPTSVNATTAKTTRQNRISIPSESSHRSQDAKRDSHPHPGQRRILLRPLPRGRVLLNYWRRFVT
jgi:hypothetical protein